MIKETIDINQLDQIIENTIHSIEESQNQICDICEYARQEYKRTEEELRELKVQIINTAQFIEQLKRKLKSSKLHLIKMSQIHGDYTEEEVREAYEIADQYRIQLAVYQEREQLLVQKRNGLEIQLKSLNKITEKAEHLNKNVSIAMDVLTGDLKNISSHIGDLYVTRLLGMKILYAQEEERRRIAREIHDGPAQLMSNMVVKSDLCLKLMDRDQDRCKYELINLKDMIQTSMGDVRRIIYDLRPMMLDDLGLLPALERHIYQIEELSGIDIYFEGEAPTYFLEPVVSLTLFRLTQEALNNIIKHSEATKVHIKFSFLDECVELFIKDNGIGFDVEEVKRKKQRESGFGLCAMKERVHLLQGNFEIRSQVGRGTRCYVTIPLTKETKGE